MVKLEQTKLITGTHGMNTYYSEAVVDGITTRQGQMVVAIKDPALRRQYLAPFNEFTQRFSGHTILTNPIAP